MADERDPKLSQHYRDLEPLEPPAELDRRILAAARERQAAHAPLVAPAGRHRWYYSLAAAAVLVLAVAITLHVERDRPDPETTATAPQARSGTITREPPAESKRADAAPAVAESRPSSPAADAPALEKPAAPTPRPAAKAQAKAKAEAQAVPEARDAMQAQGETQERARRESSVMARSAPAQPDVGGAAAARVAPPPERPEPWLERIAELRSRGRHAEADRELAAFRRAYPDYRLSEVMRERVEGR